ncbi:MAG: acyltransferase [Cyclobacteriaceae bacterium]|nr:acyltransferase [Cyclobacteriaceae bacterium]
MNDLIIKFLRCLKRIDLFLFVKNVSIHRTAIIDFNVSIINKGKIVIGEKVYLRGMKKAYQAGMPFPTALLVDIPQAELIIGANSRINGAYIHAQKYIRIGENCVIASGVNIMDSNGHSLISLNRTKGRDQSIPIKIGANVWIGLNAIILKGTTIGNNCVISAGSVVKGEFPENSLIVGNPAKAIKRLNLSDSNS